MYVKLCIAISLSTYRSFFTLYTQNEGMTAQQHGFILSGVGVLMMAVNTVGVAWLTARVNNFF